MPPVVFFVYRLLTAAWCTGSLLYLTLDTVGRHNEHNVMMFLTTWTYLALTIYFVSAFILVVIDAISGCCNSNSLKTTSKIRQAPGDSDTQTNEHFPEASETHSLTISERNSKGYDEDDFSGVKLLDPITWRMKITWIFANVIYTSALMVTIVYYILIFNSEFGGDFMDFNVHLISSVLILIDAVVVARPVRILHVLHPILYGLAYLLFSLVYWLKDKKHNILYENVINFNKPWLTTECVCAIGLIGVPTIHMLHFGIYRLRLFIYHNYCSFKARQYDNI